MILVEVETESGIVGLGEVDAWPTGDQAVISMINGKFRSLLLGEEAWTSTGCGTRCKLSYLPWPHQGLRYTP